MPLEIEVKLKVENHEAVREQLRATGAEYVGKVRETNIFFDRPDGSLRKSDWGLRVRFTTSADEPVPKALLTLKGPRQAAGLRAREAFDLTLTPHDQIVPLLLALGFQQRLLFEKDRESWRMDACLVELDTLPQLGKFIEIEGPSEERVRSVQSKIGLDTIPPVQPGYSQMVSTLLAGHADKSLIFSAGSSPTISLCSL
jgi:predicted adenylyl cyclase CyaB